MTKLEKTLNYDYKPVYIDGEILLYDIYIDGEWQGSRRTIEQVKAQVYWAFNGDRILKEREDESKAQKESKSKAKEAEILRTISAASDSEKDKISKALEDLIKKEPQRAEDCKNKPAAANWFVGQIIKEVKVKPLIVKDVVTKYFNI